MTHSCPHHKDGPPLAGVDPLLNEAFRAFKRVMHLNRQLMSRTTSEKGGHPAQIGCLIALSRHQNPTQRELAEALHIAPATLTTMLQRMERDGVIERHADVNDQRLTRVTLTDAGRERASELGKAHAANVNVLLGGLSESDRRELVRLLTLIGDNVEKELER